MQRLPGVKPVRASAPVLNRRAIKQNHTNTFVTFPIASPFRLARALIEDAFKSRVKSCRLLSNFHHGRTMLPKFYPGLRQRVQEVRFLSSLHWGGSGKPSSRKEDVPQAMNHVKRTSRLQRPSIPCQSGLDDVHQLQQQWNPPPVSTSEASTYINSHNEPGLTKPSAAILGVMLCYPCVSRRKELSPINPPIYPPLLSTTRLEIGQRRLFEQPKCTLLRLPPELRQCIYQEALGGRLISLRLVASRSRGHTIVHSTYYELPDGSSPAHRFQVYCSIALFKVAGSRISRRFPSCTNPIPSSSCFTSSRSLCNPHWGVTVFPTYAASTSATAVAQCACIHGPQCSHCCDGCVSTTSHSSLTFNGSKRQESLHSKTSSRPTGVSTYSGVNMCAPSPSFSGVETHRSI
ncbi:hypothetical protein C8R47DRAFT_192310 [Mycena vitilis]|nr:hypothetical protein C8R47DRAFT_192310 [Mycena vitilis]